MSGQQPIDWWAEPIPKVFNYVWMGKKPEKFGIVKDKGGLVIPGRAIDAIKRFAQSQEYRIYLWIDIFSMLEDNELKKILGEELWTKYDTVQVNRHGRTGAEDVIPQAGRTINDCLDTLCHAQARVSEWFGNKQNLDLFRQTNNYFKFFLDNNICGDGSGVTVRFLDTERYPRWLANEEGLEYGLIRMIVFERYARGANWGAASDMLRVQILVDEPGLYIDHDDVMKKRFDGQLKGMAFTRVSGGGALKNCWTNSFLGFCHGDHPYLLAYRKQIVKNYTALIDQNMISNGVNYTILQQPPGEPDARSEFERQTLYRSGPEVFQSIARDEKVNKVIGSFKDILERGDRETFIEGNSSKAWLKE